MSINQLNKLIKIIIIIITNNDLIFNSILAFQRTASTVEWSKTNTVQHIVQTNEDKKDIY
jgi:hypothetical protein